MRREWKKDEEDYLRESIGKYKLTTIANTLERSVHSVEMKIRRMGIYNIREQTGKLTMGTLARLLNVDRKTVQYWTMNHGLPYSAKKIKYTKTFYLIDTELFWLWAADNKDKVNFSAIEKHSIPPEPDWVDPLRVRKRNINYKVWTVGEEQMVINEFKKGKSYAEVAKKLNRSKLSVERKWSRLKQEMRA